MIVPPYLKPGDTIAIAAPARWVTPEDMLTATRVFESWNLQVRGGAHLYDQFNQFAGTDYQRANDFQQMLDDERVRAIICARGGYGTVRMMQFLDWSGFLKRPKWIVGYSDITYLTAMLWQQFEVQSIHGPMPYTFDMNTAVGKNAIESLKSALFGETLEYRIPKLSISFPRPVKAQVVGGNLSILYSLLGTRDQLETGGKLIFIEDLDEYLYHLDRMMYGMSRAHQFTSAAGVLVGSLAKMNDNTIPFGQTAEDIVTSHIKVNRTPLWFGFPSGHQEKNMAWRHGAYAEIDDQNYFIQKP